MDVSANIGVAISSARYGAPSLATPPAADPIPVGHASPAGFPSQLSAAFSDAPSSPPAEVAADVERLPPNIRFAPSHPQRDASSTAFDARA